MNTPEETHPNLAKDFKRTKPRRAGRMRQKRILRFWPLLIWLAAVAIVISVHLDDSKFGGMVGVVETTEERVAPLESARLTSINIMVGQRVEAGDIIAVMDTSLLQARKQTSLAEQEEARTSIARYQQDILILAQKFNKAIKDAEADIIKTKAAQAAELAELAELKTEQARRKKLAEKNLISIRELSELRPRIAGLKQHSATWPELLNLQQRRLTDAKNELNDLKQWLRLKDQDQLSTVIRGKMTARDKIIEAKLTLLDLKIKNYTLRASHAGVVARVQAQPGDVVQAGQEVARIVSENSTHVIGFLPEVFLGSVKKGDQAVIWRERDGRSFAATVESIAPDVRTLPGRITPMKAQTMRGRRVVLKISDPADLTPGETVRIKPHTQPFSYIRKLFQSHSAK